MKIVKPLHFSQSFQENVISSRIKINPFPKSSYNNKRFVRISNSCSSSEGRLLVDEFNPEIPIEKALTPPSSWYTNPSFLSLEFDRLFYRGWQAVGYTEQIKEAGDFFTGRLGNIEYVVCRDDNGELHAFHNVCRHHASLLAFGSGKKACFTCPYHGWTYGLDGTLLKATRITGIQNFNVNEFGLVPLGVASWGPFILLNLEYKNFPHQESLGNVGSEWLGSASEILSVNGVDSSLSYLCRREYTIECNWKVFCDNYLDGGYHVPYAHKGLASGLNLESYSTSVFEKVSIQRCDSGQVESHEDTDRLGSKALYAFIFPNFMINRYGPWMDTNLVLPLGPRKCQVIFDYFLDPSLKDDREFIESSLKDSESVQDEDIFLCEAVQKGLESPAYSSGRYAPAIEKAMHHFHCLVHENLEFGLVPLREASWGPFILLNLESEVFPSQESDGNVGSEWLGSASEILSVSGVDSSLSHLCRQEYTIECNWKVFCENYLDGGYHVPYVHKGLASSLNFESYSYSVFEKVSILMCDSDQVESHEDTDRLGSKPLYAFIYPNFMINRYGPWMITNLVLPLGPRKCQVIVDYFIDPSLQDDKEFIESSMKDNKSLQDEDIFICESVQKGLESPAYSSGRYAPAIEKAMHHFHCLVHENLVNVKCKM